MRIGFDLGGLRGGEATAERPHTDLLRWPSFRRSFLIAKVIAKVIVFCGNRAWPMLRIEHCMCQLKGSLGLFVGVVSAYGRGLSVTAMETIGRG
ncbi:MAG: hypothetical protein CMM01_09140 [Rhodopirellula sp.]|nr:hypothetical protein [Rhodopirellula sp.]